jgi:hypothetical protein
MANENHERTLKGADDMYMQARATMRFEESCHRIADAILCNPNLNVTVSSATAHDAARMIHRVSEILKEKNK